MMVSNPDNSHTDHVVLRNAAGEEKKYYLTVVHSDIPSIILVSGKAGEEANGDSETIGRLVNTCLSLGVPPKELADIIGGIDGGGIGLYRSKTVKSKADIIAVALREL